MEFGISILFWSLLIGAVAVLVADSIVLVPAYHYGVLERFRERTGKIYGEGLNFKFPLIDKVVPISMGLTAIEINVGFTTQDKLHLDLVGSLQYRPDPTVEDSQGRNLFVSMSEEIIKNGIEDMLRDTLGGLGGVYSAEGFIEHRQALGDIINNILRSDVPYHLRHDPDCQVSKCTHKGETQIDAKDLISFYDTHWQDVRKQQQGTDQSSVEKRYGIDVEVFALASIDFSKDVKDAFEKKKEAVARQEAFEFKLQMAAKAKELGADAQTALNAADVSLTPEIAKNKVVVSVEGQAGVLGGILGTLKK